MWNLCKSMKACGCRESVSRDLCENTYFKYWLYKCCDKLMRKRSFSSPMLHRRTLLTTAIWLSNEIIGMRNGSAKSQRRIHTNGNAEQYLNSVFTNFLRSIWMIVLSIMVTLCIIHMSLADLATSDAAIITNSIVSLLHTPGMMIPAEKREN